MSNSGNQQQPGFYGNTGFNAPSNGAGNPPPQQQGAAQQQNQNNGATPPSTNANTGGSGGGGSGSAFGVPPFNINANVPTPGGNGTQVTPPTTSQAGGANSNNTTTNAGALVPATTAVAGTTADGLSNSTIQTQASSATTTAMNPQQQQQAKELNAASLCRYGQETVQEIVSRTQELYQTLRGAQPPDGKAQTQAMDRKPKFQETLRNIRGLYKRLRVIYDKIEESFPASSDLPLEERIPYSDSDQDHWEPMNEKRDTEAYRQAMEEYEEVKEMVIFKNRHLRETMDLMRNIIWDINTMLAMRKE